MKPESSPEAMRPGDFGPKQQSEAVDRKEAENSSKDILNAGEISECAEYETIDDAHPQPEYEIMYKQAGSSVDMFVQMGHKTPLTSSCKDMVITILRLLTVDDKTGKAEWNAEPVIICHTTHETRLTFSVSHTDPFLWGSLSSFACMDTIERQTLSEIPPCKDTDRDTPFKDTVMDTPFKACSRSDTLMDTLFEAGSRSSAALHDSPAENKFAFLIYPYPVYSTEFFPCPLQI